MTDHLQDEISASLGPDIAIERELGGGGMARVFVASDAKLGRKIVVKVLAPDLAAGVSVQRFSREIRVAASLQHPNIVPVLTSGQTANDLPWYTMPFVAGQSLRHRMDLGPVPLPESIRILSDVARALAAAHIDDVVHRDIKPENVLLSKGVAMVTDFGIAKALADSKLATATLTDVGTSLGTPRYIAPEQAVGASVDARADVYAWGVLAYELLSGRHPFADAITAQQLIAAHLSTTARPLCEVSPQLLKPVCELVGDCLAKDPSRRPASAEQIVECLDRIRIGEPSRRAWRRLPVAAAAIVLMIGATVLIPRLRHRSRVPVPAQLKTGLTRVAVAPFDNGGVGSLPNALGSMAADWVVQGLTNTEMVEVQSLGDARASGPPRVQAGRVNASVYVTGSYYAVGDSVQFQARIADVASGDVLAVTEPTGAPLRDPTRGLDLLRQRVFLALAGQTDPRLRAYGKQSVQPPSLESYEAYERGMDAFAAAQWREATRELETAYRRDTNFVRAWVLCGVAHGNLGEWPVVDSIAHVLLRRSAHLAAADRYFVRWLAADIDGPRLDALELLRKSDALAPGTLWSFQHAWEANQLNRPREALGALQRVDTARGEAHSFASYWYQLTLAYHMLGDYHAELRAATVARRALPNSPSPLVWWSRALIAAGNVDDARRLADSVSTQLTRDPETPVRLLTEVATWAAWHGRPDLAREVAERAMRVSAAHSHAASIAPHQYELARALYIAGHWSEARKIFESLIVTDSARLAYRGYLGVLAARRGDRVAAQETADSIGRLTSRYLFADPARWRARIAAQLGNRDEATRLLDQEPQAGAGSSPLLPLGDFDLIPLQSYPPFKALIAPKG
jgi:tRNA A-37 threonylcarbamoyl transferase component Bud32/tetratricopeptide (TPR) repeat protein